MPAWLERHMVGAGIQVGVYLIDELEQISRAVGGSRGPCRVLAANH
jgi:hypothetical protein